MSPTLVIARKELADHLSSIRFVILFTLVVAVSVVTTHMAGLAIAEEAAGAPLSEHVFLMLFTRAGGLFSLVQFVAFFGPLLGLILGFDAISRERQAYTLTKLLSAPIHRDAIINGKFLAAVAVIALALAAIIGLVTGLAMAFLGLVPGAEDILRILIFYVISVFYVALWLAVAILFSILFSGVATSALAVLATWIVLSFFVGVGAQIAANVAAPVSQADAADPARVYQNYRIQRLVSLASPMELFRSATATVVDPYRKTTESFVLMGQMESYSLKRFSGPLPVLTSLLVVMPYTTALIALTLVCFGVSYAVFMRQNLTGS